MNARWSKLFLKVAQRLRLMESDATGRGFKPGRGRVLDCFQYPPVPVIRKIKRDQRTAASGYSTPTLTKEPPYPGIQAVHGTAGFLERTGNDPAVLMATNPFYSSFFFPPLKLTTTVTYNNQVSDYFYNYG
jgi:hypothetical protein